MPEGKPSADYLRHGSGPSSTLSSFHPGYSSEVTPWSGNGTPSRDSSNEPNSQEWRQATQQNSAPIPDHFLESAPPLFSALDSANFYTNLSFDQLDLDESTSVTSPFSIPIRRRDSSPNYGLSPSSLLYKYSNIAGMPEMDNRTVLSSVHDEANTINSTTTATTHTCKKPGSIAMSEHSTIRSPGQGAECNLTSGFPIHDHATHNTDASQSQPYQSMFTKSPGFDTTHFPTAADAIFHMHACDQSFADSVDNLTLFPPHSSGIQDMDTLDIAYPQRALRKVAENFQRDQNDLILSAQKKPDESLFSASTKQDNTFQQPFCPTVDDFGPNYFDSFYDNPQIFPASSSDSAPTFGQQVLKKNYCSETDSALLDVFFQEDSDLMYDDSSQGFPMKNTMDTSGYDDVDKPDACHGNQKYARSTLNQHVSRPTKLQTAESTKVVAELLAGLLDDVDVPYYMNEIESGVTSTPDGKEVSFLCEPSSLSMANSWIPSDEKNGLRTDRNQVDMEQGFEQNRDHQAEISEMAFSPSCSDSNSIVSSISSSFPCQNASCESSHKAVGLPAPPPPPPPPRLPSPQKAVTDTHTHPQAVAADVEQDNLRKKLAKIVEEGTSAENNLTLVSLHHNQVVPLIQEGPCCGLVALAMAKDLMERTDVSFEDILATSKSRGYTNLGEMFSAFDMGALAREVYACECEVLDMETTGSRELLLRHLVGGNICLVPYDADANHEPCMKKGHKAHWTFLTGILFVIRSSEAVKLPNDMVVDENIPQLYHVHSKTSSETLQYILRMADRNNILVYGRQGKSRHTGLWSLATLLTSNANLLEVSPQRVGETLEDFVLPEDGIVQSLCNKIVILYK